MKRIATKGKDALFFLASPGFLVLLILSILYWGGQAALVGYVAYKAIHLFIG